MARNQYLNSTNKPFFSVEDDDDIDDDDFLNLARNKNTNGGGTGSNYKNDLERTMQDNKQKLMDKKNEIEQNSVLSTQRALQLLNESENIGIATADELYHQREALERTDRRLDDINTTLKQSQKHIQGIRSVFGGIKNFLSRSKSENLNSSLKSPTTDPSNEQQNSNSNTRSELSETINNAKKNSMGYEHPALKIRNIEDPEKTSQSEEQADSQTIIDRNLDAMVGSLARLKGLALGLGEEIESQNDLVENIIQKSEKADINIQRQNKDMNRILKK